MPLFYQHNINATTKLAVWHIAEAERFFSKHVSVQREITHPHKRLQHLAGRYMLQILFPGFPYHLIEVATTRKPFLSNEEYHFSISHCGDYAAVIASTDRRVGIDIELASWKVDRIKHKFLNKDEIQKLSVSTLQQLTMLWSVKEAIFKWNGSAEVDFKKHMQIDLVLENTVEGRFLKDGEIPFRVFHQQLDDITLAYVHTPLEL